MNKIGIKCSPLDIKIGCFVVFMDGRWVARTDNSNKRRGVMCAVTRGTIMKVTSVTGRASLDRRTVHLVDDSGGFFRILLPKFDVVLFCDEDEARAVCGAIQLKDHL